MATIVNKFINDQRKSGTIIIDDGSEVISVRAWEDEFHLIDKSVIGQLVDIVGRVRMYNDQVYLTPEIIRKVGPDWFVLRKAELSKDKPKIKINKKEVKEEESKDENSELKDKVLKQIKKGKDKTATMEELIKVTGGDKNVCKEVLKQLLEDDLIFEPRAGKYKLLD
jgi:RPA family protein